MWGGGVVLVGGMIEAEGRWGSVGRPNRQPVVESSSLHL